LNAISESEITKYLSQYGYDVYAKAVNTVIFVDNEHTK